MYIPDDHITQVILSSCISVVVTIVLVLVVAVCITANKTRTIKVSPKNYGNNEETTPISKYQRPRGIANGTQTSDYIHGGRHSSLSNSRNSRGSATPSQSRALSRTADLIHGEHPHSASPVSVMSKPSRMTGKASVDSSLTPSNVQFGFQSPRKSGTLSQVQERQILNSISEEKLSPEQGLLSDAAFFYIADNLGHEWEKMAINLNLRIVELERIKREGSSVSLPNQVYKSLISWRRRTELDNRGKIEELFSALTDAGRQDVVDELKKKYKFS